MLAGDPQPPSQGRDGRCRLESTLHRRLGLMVDVGQTMSKIESPEQRHALLGNLYALSDPIYQQRVWIEGQKWGTVQHDEFDYAVHFFFDDSTLRNDPDGNIGWMLLDATEARLVTAVIDAIEAILQKYGTRLKDSEYITLPEWISVVEAARGALSVMPEREHVQWQ